MKFKTATIVVVAGGVLFVALNARIKAQEPLADTEPAIGSEVTVTQRWPKDDEKNACWQFTVQQIDTLWIYSPCVSKEVWDATKLQTHLIWTKELSDGATLPEGK